MKTQTILIASAFIAFQPLKALPKKHHFYIGAQGAYLFNAYKYKVSSVDEHIEQTSHHDYKNSFAMNFNVGYDYAIPCTPYKVGAQVFSLLGQTKYHYNFRPQDNDWSVNIKTKNNYLAALTFTIPAFKNALTFKLGQLFYTSKINSHDTLMDMDVLLNVLLSGQSRLYQKKRTSSPIAGLGYTVPIKTSLDFTADYFITKQKNIKINHPGFLNMAYKTYTHFLFAGIRYRF